MEEDGVKRVLFNVVLPLMAIGMLLITCYPVCQKAEGFDYFLYWILVGFPSGIRKMFLLLLPRNFGIAGSMGVLALNFIVGGLIGGFVLLVTVIRIMGNLWSINIVLDIISRSGAWPSNLNIFKVAIFGIV